MKKSKLSNSIIHLLFAVYCILAVVPIIIIVSISLTPEQNIILDGYRLFPRQMTVYAYEYVLTGNDTVPKAYLVTIYVTLAGSFLHLLISSMFAYPLAQGKLRFEKQISFYILFCLLFSGGLVPTYIMLTKLLHLKDTLTVLFFPYLASSVYLLIMKRFFSTIPHSLIQAARIDGASEYHIFFRFIIPLSTPILATIGLFVSVFIWNDWIMSALYIENVDKYSLQFLLQSIMNNIEYIQASPSANAATIKHLPSESARMAICVLAIGPIVVAYPFLQKYFVKGLTLGAIKG